MSREGIYIGKQEVIERYVGDKLVWKKRSGNWSFVQNFIFTPSHYRKGNDSSTIELTALQSMSGYPPTVTSSQRYPSINTSAYGDYKILFQRPFGSYNNREFILKGITITNTQVRRVRNRLNVTFIFNSYDDREEALNIMQLGNYFELHRQE